MSEMWVAVGADVPVELSLLALALVQGSERAPSSGFARIREEPIEGDRLEVKSNGFLTTIESRSPSFHLKTREGSAEYRWFLPVHGPRRESRASRMRLGIEGGSDTRRLRMTWRTLGELRRRELQVTPIVVGSCELSPATEERPDELHTSLVAHEYVALLDRVDVVLECTDSFGTESFLAVAARQRGIPVVAHRDRPDLVHDERSLAAMWSADGFIEALLATGRERRAPTDPRGSLAEIIDRLEGR